MLRRTIRKVGGAINTATGGAAGKAWEASKSIPGIGAVTTNFEKGLNMADRASSAGLQAIAIGERGAAAFKSGNVGGLKSAPARPRGCINHCDKSSFLRFSFKKKVWCILFLRL
jgi:hypothetical protein